jgi:hypothetical protein
VAKFFACGQKNAEKIPAKFLPKKMSQKKPYKNSRFDRLACKGATWHWRC